VVGVAALGAPSKQRRSRSDVIGTTEQGTDGWPEGRRPGSRGVRAAVARWAQVQLEVPPQGVPKVSPRCPQGVPKIVNLGPKRICYVTSASTAKWWGHLNLFNISQLKVPPIPLLEKVKRGKIL
jgi:hypothetical protein